MKAISGYEVVEVQTNGERIVRGKFPPKLEQSARDLCASMNDQWNHAGVEFFVKELRHA